jgi:neural Wiskott-Aldrich syndrome protein
MRGQVPREAEIRISPTWTAQLESGLAGDGQTHTRSVGITSVMSLRLTAPKGGFIIEPQSPESQWVHFDEPGWEQKFAALRFTVTPTKRGKNFLRVTLSHRRVDALGLMAESTLPDETIDVMVSVNLARVSIATATSGLSLIAGAALGASFPQIVQLLKGLGLGN